MKTYNTMEMVSREVYLGGVDLTARSAYKTDTRTNQIGRPLEWESSETP